MAKRNLVAITGLGVVSPLGFGAKNFFSALMNGQSGIRRIDAPFVDELSSKIAAQVDFNSEAYFSRMQLNQLDRVSQFALVAAREAWVDAGLDKNAPCSERTGVYLGCGLGGAASIESGYRDLFEKKLARVSPYSVILTMTNAPASHISIEFGLQGPNQTFSTACSSSGMAIGEAMRAISHGYADCMVAGGAEALLSYGTIRAWESLRTLAREDTDNPSASCRPFSRDRNGLVLGEGAAILVLEELERAKSRHAPIYAILRGFGSAADASHLTKPNSQGQARAMRLALDDAGLAPDRIGYINAHGTATVVGDETETHAIKEVFGSRAYGIPVSATKSMHGHLMGATAALEFVATVMALKTLQIPPTMFLRQPDPLCDLDYVVNAGRDAPGLEVAMSNAFAFGGSNAVLVASRA
ncbi:MAG: beta-ketoacyl-[acyl-carrier-protein] synthase family protein [Pseudomonadota bacterium]|nr:beta-ketoacyl-[acyl-carrier-protein] synthase family protein [Pseudomonadota bacterium]